MQKILEANKIGYDLLFTLQKANFINLEELQQFFQDLPVDPYIKGSYRRRRLSRFSITDGKVVKLPHGRLFQSKEYNPVVGNIHREFHEIDDALVLHEDFARLLLAFNDACKLYSDSREIGVHQIRTTCSATNFGNPAPEGIHRDGTDLIAIFSIGRHNVKGGETHLYRSKKESPVFNKTLNPGELLLLNDREFFHYTTPVKPLNDDTEGTRDVFVLTCPSLLS